MIIKLSFKDNDFTQILEEFLDRSMCMNIRYCLNKYKSAIDEYSLKKYVELSQKIETLNEKLAFGKEMTEDDKQLLIELEKESILDYIRDRYRNNYKELSNNLTIELINSVEDKWENGENIYYFPMHGKYVTM